MNRLFVFIGLLVLFSCNSNQKTDIVYVQNLKLYSEFDLALELDAQLQAFSENRKRELDSLSLSLQNLTGELEQMNEIPAETYQYYNDLRNMVMFKQKNYEEELIGMSQEFDQQIWERINLYVAEYAEENNYDMILGASGNGSLMYAKDALDITDELIAYCNNNYNGVK